MRLRPSARLSIALLIVGAVLAPTGISAAQPDAPAPPDPTVSTGAASGAFDPSQTTIAEVHAAFEREELTCEQLVERYLDRIAAYDDDGPAINAILEVNADALATAQQLDEDYRASGPTGPLHCVPMLIKDNLDTADLPTTGASLSLEGSVPPNDSFVVRRLRDAGAIVLAKTNLDEFARGSSGLSSLGGQTLNPYGLDRIPGGSSGGTGAGIAADFALAGIGTETGVSIRNPAANNNLVGIAPTRGLVSRSGIIPISFTQDRAGPLTRTVEDAARILDVIAGFDPDDDQTALSVDRIPSTYLPGDADASAPKRVGVVRELFGSEPSEAETEQIVDAAIADLDAAGVEVVQDVPIQEALDDVLPWLDPLYPNDDQSLVRVLSDARTNNYEFRDALNDYLAKRGPTSPIANLEELIESGLFLPGLRNGLEGAQEGLGLDDPEYAERLLRISALQRATLQAMAELELDGLVYPMKTQTATPITGGAPPSTIASSGNVLGSITGFPSVVVPAGFAEDGLPVGLEILGRPFTEDVLLDVATTYEDATDHRRLPASTPPLTDGGPGEPPTEGTVCDRMQGGATFPDAPGSGHGAFIDCLAALGVVQGKADGTFAPADDVSRAQLASFVVRAIELATGEALPASDQPFPDVGATSTHGQAIAKLASAGIIQGYTDGTFRPSTSVTRDQTARYVTNALELIVGASLPRTGASFPDVAPGSHYASDIDALVSAEVVAGFPDGTFRPRAAVTRGQMARLIGTALGVAEEYGVYQGP